MHSLADSTLCFRLLCCFCLNINDAVDVPGKLREKINGEWVFETRLYTRNVAIQTIKPTMPPWKHKRLTNHAYHVRSSHITQNLPHINRRPLHLELELFRTDLIPPNRKQNPLLRRLKVNPEALRISLYHPALHNIRLQ